MARIKLVLSDMDGTLLPFGAHEVSPRTIASVGALHEAGIAFGPSSGRERSDLIRYFHGDERCVATGIMGNGKLVYLDGELVYRRPLPRDQVEALAQAVSQLPGAMLNFYLPLDERGHGKPGFGCIGVTEEEKSAFPSEGFDNGIFMRLPDGDITTCAVILNPDIVSVDEARAAVSDACPRLEFPLPSPIVFDVLERGWTKVSALPILLDHLGITTDEIAYLGDSQNDLTMMGAIPHSFCMGNGSDEAKAAAQWVVDTCEDDGAAKVMESLARNGGTIVEENWWG
ncbi:MAG: HAD family phosphatase [Atopobiaceae bacterium]|nr:HAD family phosphatase [Atopobiaceae bacterium]